MTGRKVVGILFLVGAAVVGGFMLWGVRRPEYTPAVRGYRIADRVGCFACHGPGGTGGVPNPGSGEGTIESWMGEADLTDAEIREWILHGQSRASGEGLLQMPPYGEILNERDVSDLVAYVRAVAGPSDMPEAARAGYETAERFGCFACHGPSGRVGRFNPGSLTGIVPPWDSDSYAELVRDGTELREWIFDGAPRRLVEDRLARRFLARAKLKMPAYRGVMTDAEFDAIAAYISWLRKEWD